MPCAKSIRLIWRNSRHAAAKSLVFAALNFLLRRRWRLINKAFPRIGTGWISQTGPATKVSHPTVFGQGCISFGGARRQIDRHKFAVISYLYGFAQESSLRQVLFCGDEFGAAFSQTAMAADDLVPCEKNRHQFKIDAFDPYTACCQQGDAGGNVGLRYEGLTADSGGIHIKRFARRAVGDSYRKAISDAEVQRLAQKDRTDGWVQAARSWSPPSRIGEGGLFRP